jgi:DNA-binding NarL/FixJ family response regulator
MTRPLIRIMIADSFDVVRRGVRLLVETRDYCRVVGEACNGRDALTMARDTRPNIAIVDYSLPELNGLDLAHEIRKASPATEVLIFTSHNREEIVVSVLRSGVRGFVLKSDPDDSLMAAVDSLSVNRPYFSRTVSDLLLERFLQTKADEFEGSLTHRERQVVQLIAEGRINKQIGHILDISVKTVETHRASAMHKLNLRTTADLVRYAIRNNLAQP